MQNDQPISILRRPAGPIAIAAVLAALPWPMRADAVTMTGDSRRVVAGAFPATGLLRCPGGTGTGHLVGAGSAVLTAAHVVIGAGGGGCSFTLNGSSGSITLPVDLARIRSGSANPRQEPAARDWAVVRLAQPAQGVRPYAIGGTPATGSAVTLVSGRTLGQGGATVEQCKVRAQLPGPEMAIDCSAQSGDSGAALLSSGSLLVGVYVGFRSVAPSRSAAFSDKHYNFALPISGALRAAISEISR